jgi:hypothetical protein
MALPPRKPRKPKSKKINVGVKQQWESILKTVNKDEVPVELLQSLSVNLIDGTKVNIDIKEMIEAGAKPKEIEKMINEKLEQLDDYIFDVDFFICVETVANTVQPITNEILKNI